VFEWYGEIKAKLPRVAPVRQKFPKDSIADVAAVVAKEMAKPEIEKELKLGLRAAILVGSRGIGRLDEIVRALVNELKQRGVEPFIIPAMGSHGGGIAEKQAELLAGYNITAESMGVPVRASMEVVSLGEVEPGLPVYVDKITATEADIIIPVARVKPHTSFRGKVESGLYKMLVIGMGKHKGAQTIHEQGFERFHELIPKAGEFILERTPVRFGLAIVENSEDMPAVIELVPAAEFASREPELLELSRSLMARINFTNIDVLVIREIGKNISGGGMDPNITGRFNLPHIKDGPLMAKKIVVLDLTEETHGNATGIGLADTTTRRLVEKIDFHATYTNLITSTKLDRARVPVVMEDDYKAIALAVQTLNRVPDGQARLVIIKNTLELENIYVSEALLPEIENNPQMEVLGPVQEIPFGPAGELLLP
jgi:hypothetical protein